MEENVLKITNKKIFQKNGWNSYEIYLRRGNMRKEKSLKNLLTSVIPYLILTVLGFLRLKVLLEQLGTEIYALNIKH